MNKRGALFYIIDAFVAASILVITIIIILSTQVNSPKVLTMQEALDNYVTYLQKTNLSNIPEFGSNTKQQIIEDELILNLDIDVLSAIIQLHIQGNPTIAQTLLEDVNQIAIEPQYGIEINITRDANPPQTILIDKEARRANSEAQLSKTLVIPFYVEQKEEIQDFDIALSDTGQNTCNSMLPGSTCKYINHKPIPQDQTYTGNKYEEDDCLTVQNSGEDEHIATCYLFQPPSQEQILVEVSIWS